MAYKNPLRADIEAFCAANGVNTKTRKRVYIDCYRAMGQRRMRVKFAGVRLCEYKAIQLQSYLFERGYRDITVNRDTGKATVSKAPHRNWYAGLAVTVDALGAYAIANERMNEYMDTKASVIDRLAKEMNIPVTKLAILDADSGDIGGFYPPKA